MMLGEDPKHVFQLDTNLSLSLSLGLSPSIRLSLSLVLDFRLSLSLSLSLSPSLSLGLGLGQASRGCIWESSGGEHRKYLIFFTKTEMFTKALKRL